MNPVYNRVFNKKMIFKLLAGEKLSRKQGLRRSLVISIDQSPQRNQSKFTYLKVCSKVVFEGGKVPNSDMKLQRISKTIIHLHILSKKIPELYGNYKNLQVLLFCSRETLKKNALRIIKPLRELRTISNLNSQDKETLLSLKRNIKLCHLRRIFLQNMEGCVNLLELLMNHPNRENIVLDLEMIRINPYILTCADSHGILPHLLSVNDLDGILISGYYPKLVSLKVLDFRFRKKESLLQIDCLPSTLQALRLDLTRCMEEVYILGQMEKNMKGNI